jgi:hypothetical protein
MEPFWLIRFAAAEVPRFKRKERLNCAAKRRFFAAMWQKLGSNLAILVTDQRRL